MEIKEPEVSEHYTKTLQKFSNLVLLLHDTALMRYHQKSFFREKENAKLKNEHLVKSKEYEKKVDTLLNILWPQPDRTKQQKLF